MTGILLDLGVILGAIASLLHVVIFVMESVLWTRPTVWRRFGLKTADEAATTQPLALNQGFYNLFLAIGTVIGLVFLSQPSLLQAGFALAFVCLGSMLAASVVLLVSNPRLARAALTQGLIPLLAIVALAIAAATA
ncbi:MAG: epimerase [Glaciihabitans sp.]|nr:epimerase [Glaciihabitans sp.]